ncbi:MAG TPA: RNA 2',3'-cyclic phosphodiesterase [Chloroflexi bacterium]|nr:RNA 2',3'-cyclic phosphodiesterase [Chloroflexota bacterium]
MPAVRIFVAIELPSTVLDALEEMQSRLRHGKGGRAGRWVARDNIHLTLKFLGDIPEEALNGIFAAVQQACAGHAPFEIHTTGPGCFPNTRRPRVIWAGVREGTGRLTALQRDIDRALARLGHAPDDRAFRPHLTLARIQRNAARIDIEALGGAIADYAPEPPVSFTAHEVCTIKSDLRPQGPVYTILSRAPLKASTD